MIRPATIDDAAAITRIYNHYVLNTVITFEEEPVSDDEMRGRIVDVTRRYPWFVDEVDGEINAYAYACPWRTRSAYRYSAELAVYVEKDRHGKGTGRAIYRALIDELARKDIRLVIGGVTLPNPASVALHETFRFKKVAHFEKVGFKFGQWLDVGFWELILNDGPFAA